MMALSAILFYGLHILVDIHFKPMTSRSALKRSFALLDVLWDIEKSI